jgi:glycosyltransferase involved in cell wall biosynthesis
VKVSVVVPLYNKAPFLLRALQSISAQSFADFEAIVVNDGSTDSSLQVAQSHRDSRFRFLSQENAGPGAARNRGLAEATGEYVAFLDADDEWLPDFLAAGVARLEGATGAASAVTSSYFETPPGESSTRMWASRGLRNGIVSIDARTPPSLVVSILAFMSPCSTIARTDVVRRFGGFFDRYRCLYAEDAHLWLKFLLNEAVIIDLEPRVRFHRDASDLSANLAGARPVEPFLDDPTDILRATPRHLAPLLQRVLAIRAYKTACVLGYWGDWRGAGALRRRFAAPSWPPLPYQFASRVCSTPLGAVLGSSWRRLRGLGAAAER